MEQDERQHYFIKYNGDLWKHYVVRPEQVDIFYENDDNAIESKEDYSNDYENKSLTVRIHVRSCFTITVPHVNEIWIFPLYGALSYAIEERPRIHPNAVGGYQI